MKRVLALLALAPLLGGCLHTLGGSVAGTECKFLERPEYAVRGARPYDQDWIDSTVEGAVGACKWQRPAPRPAELDEPKAAIAPKVVVKPAKKPGVLGRIKAAWPVKQAVPVVGIPAAPESPAPVAAPIPCRPIDELLRSCGK